MQARLIKALLLLIALGSVATVAGNTLVLDHVMKNRLDMQVEQAAERWRVTMPPQDRLLPEQVPAVLSVRQEIGTVGAIIDGADVVVAWRVNGPGVTEPLPEAAHRGIVSLAVGTPPRTVDLGSLGDYRMIAFFTPYGDRVALGLPEELIEATVDALLLIELIIGGGVLVGAALTAIATIRRAMRPLSDMAVTATRVSALHLDQGEVPTVERVPGLDAVTGTEVDQVGVALNRMLDHVETALRARQTSEELLRQFLDDAAHEMRTPLSTIRGHAELSSMYHGMSPEAAQSMERIRAQADRMTGLVEDLLLLARLGSGRPTERRRVDLTRLVIDAVNDAIISWPDHRWYLDLPSAPVTVPGDGNRLTQMLTNLLSNARRHTLPGTNVTVSLAENATGVCLAVVDDGPGIDPELLPSVFQRFVRRPGHDRDEDGSNGLGLSIVDAIAVAHGGTVEVSSHPGMTRFTVRLPRTRPSTSGYSLRTEPVRRHSPLTPRLLPRRTGSRA